MHANARLRGIYSHHNGPYTIICILQADSTTGTATFFDYFKSTAQKMLYLGQDLCVAPYFIRDLILSVY